MKLIKCRSALVLALLLGVFAVAANAQTEPMAGGYKAISTGSATARSAAAVAIKKHSSTHAKDEVSLVKIVKAEQQVVAGMNYRLCLSVIDRKGVRRTVTAVVWAPPGKKMRLTNWQAGGCKEL